MNIDIYMKNISFAGIANYIKMFQDERVANATFHTFYFALLEVPLQMIVALLLLMFMLRNTKPVSYTHLDVYKRQDQRIR